MEKTYFNITRRQVLKSAGGLAGATLMPNLFAAINNSINGTSRVGLVIGNSTYHKSPLTNPANDAKAIAETLSGFGFKLTLLLDAGINEMVQSIDKYISTLATEGGVGLFYFAGHGAQLAWRNFLIPVDARIKSMEDVPKQTYELNSLLKGLSKASNKMNIIILDACRDNPFGAQEIIQQKGLSQFDAPPSSLLCYATAPGNTASDGDGENGLFTENLLREMRKPDAKIEDVFKRVRLNVRMQSKGQQIPWESTSLEDDFFFVPQDLTGKKHKEELEAKINAEKISWNIVSDSQDSKVIEKHVKEFPNGIFSELAQAKLDKVLLEQGEKKVNIITSSSNPFSKGSSNGTGKYSIGDKFSYTEKDPISGAVQKSWTETVTSITEFTTVFDNGNRVIDLLGNEIKSPIPRFLSPAQFYPAEYKVGNRWTTQFDWLKSNGLASLMVLNFNIIERKEINSPSGVFNAFIVEGRGRVIGGGEWKIIYFIDPEKCSRPFSFEMIGRGGVRSIDPLSHRIELVSYNQKKT